MNDATTRIDYDQIRERAHRLRREATLALFDSAFAKLKSLVGGRAPGRFRVRLVRLDREAA